MEDLESLSRPQLVALGIVVAALIAARESAEESRAGVDAEIIEDDGVMSLVLTPVAA